MPLSRTAAKNPENSEKQERPKLRPDGCFLFKIPKYFRNIPESGKYKIVSEFWNFA
jgi:hypothetical protein